MVTRSRVYSLLIAVSHTCRGLVWRWPDGVRIVCVSLEALIIGKLSWMVRRTFFLVVHSIRCLD